MSNKIPAHILRNLMVASWKAARSAAKTDGASVQSHLPAAMRAQWETARFLIKTARVNAKAVATRAAATPSIPAIVTSSDSERQRAYAESVVAKRAALLADGFRILREETDVSQHPCIDAAIAAFTGAPARFWLDIISDRAPQEVAMLLSCRAGGIEIDPRTVMPTSARLAAMI